MKKLILLALVLGLHSVARATLPNAWHIPDNAIVSGNGGTTPTMRNPRAEFGNTGTIRIFSGLQKFNNGFGTADQNGGTVYYKSADQMAWSSAPLSFHANTGNDQYWYADLSLANVTANKVIQYYIALTFNAGPADNAFIYGGGDQGGSLVTANNATAAAAPYTVRNRPAWVFHANNRVISGVSVQFWSELGYISDSNDFSTRWADHGAVYYTTDGSTPAGSLGVGTGTTQVLACSYDHPEENNQGGQSVAGKPMWWVATAPTLLQNVPLGGTIKYKIGFWHSANNEEKFADYQTSTANQVFTFTNGTVGDPVLTVNGVNANYTTTHFFVDEVAADSKPVSISFAPGQPNITQIEVFTNLNRRDRAQLDANGDGIEDGIKPPDGNLATVGDNNYFTAYTMTDAGGGNYTLTLQAQKTGAYRLTARWKVTGDSNWHWYSGSGRRDHAIVVSPVDSRDISLYEVNVLNIESNDNTPGDSSDDFSHRSTFEDLYDAPNAPHQGADARWNLDYLKNLGCNWVWFQPVHPIGVEGQSYYPGSPYAVKNFFEINPLMSVGNTRAAAMAAFQGFVSAADIKGVGVMLDAPFNHTSPDAEVSTMGVPLFGGTATTEMRNQEARFFSQSGNYGARATGAGNIAVAPDRGDFGKWDDVRDVFFGNYSALVSLNPQDNGNFTNETDFFDFNSSNFDAVTRNVWKYFAEYPLYWLEKTGVPAGSDLQTQTTKGIDGLRADFGQGLPPQLWEYIINKTRTRKWNFVFMSESLDGGAVTYRSNRHFDILNENIVFPLASATSASDYRNIFEARRTAYGQSLVLLNDTSHDEENYTDPFQALVRYAVVNTVDGAPLVFQGQELGISRTFGFQSYETNFGKQIAHFKKFNSMMPIWNDTNFGNDQLYPVYSGIGEARQFSDALRSSNRWFLDGDGTNSKIYAVAKYEQDGASPAVSDVVLAFANIDRDNDESDNFKIPATLETKLGIKDSRFYNVKNIAAYLGADGNRRSYWLWNGSTGYTGAQLKNNGVAIFLKKVPTTNGAWATAPYEAQYLKVYDVTPLPAPSSPPTVSPYALDGSAPFTWNAVVDPEGLTSIYRVTVTRSDGPVTSFETSTTNYTVTGIPSGATATATVVTLNPNNTTIASSPTASSPQTFSLTSTGDNDGDGMSNAAEITAGTSPLDPTSLFKITSIAPAPGGGMTITWDAVPGKTYTVEASTNLSANNWTTLATGLTTGTYTDHNPDPGSEFYRVRTGP
ncbi:MAG: alpha-amylase family glycosyl hydrolase [Chthoniobacterales bacterium]